MSNFILGYGDVGTNCVYSGGTWNTNLPLAMLNNTLITAIAKTTSDTTLTLNITIDQEDVSDIEVMGIINHNISPAGLIRWQCYSDSGRSIKVFDSGSLPITTFFDKLNYNTTVSVATSAAYQHRYWKLTVTDPNNPDNYFKIGRIFLGKRFDMDRNMDYGAEMGTLDSSTSIESSVNGIETAITYPRKRYANFSMSLMQYTKSDEHFRMGMETGISTSVLFEFNPEEVKGGIYSFVGRMYKLNPLFFPYYNVNDFSVSIVEII